MTFRTFFDWLYDLLANVCQDYLMTGTAPCAQWLIYPDVRQDQLVQNLNMVNLMVR